MRFLRNTQRFRVVFFSEQLKGLQVKYPPLCKNTITDKPSKIKHNLSLINSFPVNSFTYQCVPRLSREISLLFSC